MAEIWGAALAAVVGGGLAIAGQNKQEKANEAAQTANQNAVAGQNLAAWQNALMMRGINPSGVTQTGVIPQNAQPVNTKLPLWARLPTPTGNTPVAIARRPGAAPVGASPVPQGYVRRRTPG